METIFYIESDMVMKREDFADGSFIESMHGLVNKTETIRIDPNTVEDVAYLFDLELGEYVEQSRAPRALPLPPVPVSDADKITALEQQLAQTNSDLAALMEAVFLAP